MSADNYYTIKFNREDLKWYPLHGFMSSLDEDVPALLRGGETGYEEWKDAVDSVIHDYSEYGVIQEHSPLDEILTLEQWKYHLENTIRRAQEHLDWITEGDE